MRLTQFEEVIQSEELAYTLRGASTCNEPVLPWIQKQQLVDIASLWQLVRARLNTRWWVTFLIIHHRAGNMASELGQVAGELVDPIDSTNVDFTRFVMDDQMRKPSLWWDEVSEGREVNLEPPMLRKEREEEKEEESLTIRGGKGPPPIRQHF